MTKIQDPGNPKKTIDLDEYQDVRACSVNETHVDFYKEKLPPDNLRHDPDYIVALKTKEERDSWFSELVKKFFSNKK